ncbi:hypothetical protein [Streptomyces sp. NBC_01262]|uniref:hypothetical protein n=1 Tax=Streptomyces sp. NBC_01262 TaxID=2903803 RepID=UPI002E2EB254|nr:hypothetical protein [Streptomyces sp. NBC_01262]
MTTTEPRPRLKSLTPTPDQPSTAEPADTPTGRSAPKFAARQGVLSSLRPDPQADDGRWPLAWLHIVAPPSWRAPARAVSHCACGRHVEAVGRDDVLALVEAHTAHRTVCPLRNPAPERRQAA